MQERDAYDPYGTANVLTPTWTARASSLFGWVYLHQNGRYDAVSGLYDFRRREYSPALGRWMTDDPKLFAADDVNLYRYEWNDPARFTDESGLEPQRPDSPIPWDWNAEASAWDNFRPVSGSSKNKLSKLLQELDWMAKSRECKAEAWRIAMAIMNTFRGNNPWYIPKIRPGTDDRNKGYYCYEWTYAFEDAFKLESSGKCFKVSLGGAVAPGEEGRVHSWIVITSIETGQSVYVDDGFADGSYVHNQPPRPAGYTAGDFLPNSDKPRSTCSVPKAYPANVPLPPDRFPPLGEMTQWASPP